VWSLAVPGWSTVGLTHSAFHTPTVRGQVQAVQFLHDGVSLFDPFVNIPSATRVQPMELIKRVEMITGPGGVLWGSNSLLGILNVITKDAEDVEGVEVGGQLGDGRGDRLMGRAYVMAGKSDILDGKLKVFGHASVDTYQGPEHQLPLLLFHGALPQPARSGRSTGLGERSAAVDDRQPRAQARRTASCSSAWMYPFGRSYTRLPVGQPVARLPRTDAAPTASDPSCAVRCTRAARITRTRSILCGRSSATRFAKKDGQGSRAVSIQFGARSRRSRCRVGVDPGGLACSTISRAVGTRGAIDGDVELSCAPRASTAPRCSASGSPRT
jgi:hypothetical protein